MARLLKGSRIANDRNLSASAELAQKRDQQWPDPLEFLTMSPGQRRHQIVRALGEPQNDAASVARAPDSFNESAGHESIGKSAHRMRLQHQRFGELADGQLALLCRPQRNQHLVLPNCQADRSNALLGKMRKTPELGPNGR